MLRFTGAIGGSLAALVAVPAAVFGADGSAEALASVERALARTVQALEVLAGLGERSAAGEPVTAAVVREVTEPAPAEPGAREENDRRLEILRAQVSLLQQELDLVETRALEAASAQDDLPVAVEQPRPSPLLGVTRGLDDHALAQLAELGAQRDANARPSERPVEHAGYSADPLLQAQACYRAGRFEHGARLLAGNDAPVALYWRARCLERLERLSEALALYEILAVRPDAASFADRARTSLEFVRWRQEFEQKLSALPAGAETPAKGAEQP